MNIDTETIEKLIGTALEYRLRAYTPYSGYNVGAAALFEDGSVTGGCNVENAAYSPGICAERNAIYKAVSEGHRKLKAIAVAGSPAGDEISQYACPCGVCRQVMREFADPGECEIIVVGPAGEYRVHTLAELLPESFGPDNLGK